MSYPGPGAQPTQLIVDGAPVSASNPLPIESTGSGSALPVQIEGLQQNGATIKPVGVDNFGNLGVALADPLTALQTASSTATTNVSLNWHEE